MKQTSIYFNEHTYSSLNNRAVDTCNCCLVQYVESIEHAVEHRLSLVPLLVSGTKTNACRRSSFPFSYQVRRDAENPVSHFQLRIEQLCL